MPKHRRPLVLARQGPPAGGDAAGITAALAPVTARYEVRAGPRRVSTQTYLDTVDGRVRRAGLLLRHVLPRGTRTGGGRLELATAGGRAEPVVQPLGAPPEWPARVEHLPPGPVRDGVTAAMWVRAVAPVTRTRTLSREVAVLDGEGKTVVRLEWAEVAGVEPLSGPVLTRLTVRPVRGYRREARTVVRGLLAGGGFTPATGEVTDELTGAAAATPPTAAALSTPATAAMPAGDTTGLPAVAAGMPADVAVAAALLRFAADITAAVDGAIDDVDTEFLHDLRVGVRRTRSLLKQAGDVLPPRLAPRYTPGFRWLGDLTTPTRDLDVYLLELDDLAGRLVAGAPTDLDPFAAHLRRRRATQHRTLVRGLRSQRFATLLAGWQQSLTAIVEQGPADAAAGGTTPTVERLAAERLTRSGRRVLRMARAVTPDSPAAAVHALRKRCKELRYLLETFRPLCDPGAYRTAIKDLKRLQDVLGAFQDGEVQSEGLRTFAAQMLATGSPPAATLLAMGELASHFAVQQRRARADLTGRLRRYLRTGTAGRIVVLQP